MALGVATSRLWVAVANPNPRERTRHGCVTRGHRTGVGSCQPNWGDTGDREFEASSLGRDPVRPRCGIVPDPDGIITAGHNNKTARTISYTEGEQINGRALSALLKQIIANNRAGGWRKLKKP